MVFCRLLEVDGECVTGLTDCALYKLLNSKDCGPMSVVLLRATMSADDVESLREDLSLALLELESTQAENTQLTAELARCVPSDTH